MNPSCNYHHNHSNQEVVLPSQKQLELSTHLLVRDTQGPAQPLQQFSANKTYIHLVSRRLHNRMPINEPHARDIFDLSSRTDFINITSTVQTYQTLRYGPRKISLGEGFDLFVDPIYSTGTFHQRYFHIGFIFHESHGLSLYSFVARR